MMNAVNSIAAVAAGSGKSDGGLIKATVTRGPSGDGVFTLRLSGGREIDVQVQAAEDGAPALSLGQKVLVSPSDGKLFIPPEDAAERPAQSQEWAPPRQTAQLLQQAGGGDRFVSGKQPADAAPGAAAGETAENEIGGEAGGKTGGVKGAAPAGQTGFTKIVGFKTVSEGEAHADGIYKADAAGHILEGQRDGEATAPIKDFAAVRLNTVNGQQVVTVIAGDGLQAALEELRGSFESPLLRALPLELLKALFDERGYIDTGTLKALDAVLATRGLSIDTLSPQQLERVGQWLRIALDNPGMVPELADRIPALGAKEAAGLLELIGRLSPDAAPESFFATGNTFPKTAVKANISGVDLLQNLVKAAFSAAPDALLNLVKRIDASSAALGARLPPAEAARVAREITTALPAQTAAKPGALHDARQLSPRALETPPTPARQTQSPASVAPQIRTGYSELTEIVVRTLAGGDGKKDAVAVGEKISALREAVGRMPVTIAGYSAGHDTATPGNGGGNIGHRGNISVNINGGISDNGGNGNSGGTVDNLTKRDILTVSGGNSNNSDTVDNSGNSRGNRAVDRNAPANAQTAGGRLSAPAGGNNANAAKAPEPFPHVNAQIAVHRASGQTGGINISANAAPAPSIPLPGGASRNAGTVSRETGVASGKPAPVDISRGVNNVGGAVINRPIPVDNLHEAGTNNASGSNAGSINPADNKNIGSIGTDPKINNGNGADVAGVGGNRPAMSEIKNINTTGIDTVDNKNGSGDAGTGVNRPLPADNFRGTSTGNAGGIDTDAINTVDSKNRRNETGDGINKPLPADNSRVGGNTDAGSGKPIPVDSSRGVSGTDGVVIGRPVHVDDFRETGIKNASGINTVDNKNIGGSGVNANSGTVVAATPPDIQAIRESCLSIVDTLRISVAPVLRELARRGELGAEGSAQLIGLVREAVSSLDEALRPLVRAERPVPPEFYGRVTAEARDRISAEAKNALFSQIGSTQALIRNAVKIAEGGNPAVSPGTGNHNIANVNSSINTNVNTAVNSNNPFEMSADDGTVVADPARNSPNAEIERQQRALDKNGAAQHDYPADGQTKGNTSVNTNVNSGINTNAAAVASNSPFRIVADAGAVVAGPPRDLLSSPSGNIPVFSENMEAGSRDGAPVNATTNPASPPPPPGPPDFLRVARRIWANTETLRDGFREAFSALDLRNRASPLDRPADSATAGTVRRSADALRTEMLIDVSRALSGVFSSVDELRELVSRLSSDQNALPEAEAALLRAVRSLERQARQSGAEVMERLKDMLKELNRLQADAARVQEQGGAATRPSPAEAIRSAALTAARSLENLQLLATQTRAAETEQHLIAIPAKIGGEWTEVQIKFVKERKQEKDGARDKDGHVSIYLNVAPSALGLVTAHLDYHPPNLKLAFRFEKPEVTRWFRQNAGELREALAQAGLPGTTLEFHSKRPVNNEPVRPPSALDNNVVDDAGEFEIKDGKVDFKI
jgi:hypothetical protein